MELVELYRQMELVEEGIRDKLYRNDDERELYHLIRMARLLKQLYSMELISREYAYLKDNYRAFTAEKYADFIRENANKYGAVISGGYDLSEITKGVDEAMSFYSEAEARDNALLANTINKMRAEGKQVAALITGGYHTKGLTDLMSQKGLSYLVVVPKFENGKERPYVAILTNKKKEYEKILQTGKYQLAVQGYFDQYNGDLSRIKEGVLHAMGEAVLEGKRMAPVKEAWVKAYETAYENMPAEKKIKAVSPEEFTEYLNKIAPIKIGRKVVIQDLTDPDPAGKGDFITLIRKKDGSAEFFDFRVTTESEKKRFMDKVVSLENRILGSKLGEIPDGEIIAVDLVDKDINADIKALTRQLGRSRARGIAKEQEKWRIMEMLLRTTNYDTFSNKFAGSFGLIQGITTGSFNIKDGDLKEELEETISKTREVIEVLNRIAQEGRIRLDKDSGYIDLKNSLERGKALMEGDHQTFKEVWGKESILMSKIVDLMEELAESVFTGAEDMQKTYKRYEELIAAYREYKKRGASLFNDKEMTAGEKIEKFEEIANELHGRLESLDKKEITKAFAPGSELVVPVLRALDGAEINAGNVREILMSLKNKKLVLPQDWQDDKEIKEGVEVFIARIRKRQKEEVVDLLMGTRNHIFNQRVGTSIIELAVISRTVDRPVSFERLKQWLENVRKRLKTSLEGTKDQMGAKDYVDELEKIAQAGKIKWVDYSGETDMPLIDIEKSLSEGTVLSRENHEIFKDIWGRSYVSMVQLISLLEATDRYLSGRLEEMNRFLAEHEKLTPETEKRLRDMARPSPDMEVLLDKLYRSYGQYKRKLMKIYGDKKLNAERNIEHEIEEINRITDTFYKRVQLSGKHPEEIRKEFERGQFKGEAYYPEKWADSIDEDGRLIKGYARMLLEVGESEEFDRIVGLDVAERENFVKIVNKYLPAINGLRWFLRALDEVSDENKTKKIEEKLGIDSKSFHLFRRKLYIGTKKQLERDGKFAEGILRSFPLQRGAREVEEILRGLKETLEEASDKSEGSDSRRFKEDPSIWAPFLITGMALIMMGAFDSLTTATFLAALGGTFIPYFVYIWVLHSALRAPLNLFGTFLKEEDKLESLMNRCLSILGDEYKDKIRIVEDKEPWDLSKGLYPYAYTENGIITIRERVAKAPFLALALILFHEKAEIYLARAPSLPFKEILANILEFVFLISHQASVLFARTGIPLMTEINTLRKYFEYSRQADETDAGVLKERCENIVGTLNGYRVRILTGREIRDSKESAYAFTDPENRIIYVRESVAKAPFVVLWPVLKLKKAEIYISRTLSSLFRVGLADAIESLFWLSYSLVGRTTQIERYEQALQKDIPKEWLDKGLFDGEGVWFDKLKKLIASNATYPEEEYRKSLKRLLVFKESGMPFAFMSGLNEKKNKALLVRIPEEELRQKLDLLLHNNLPVKPEFLLKYSVKRLSGRIALLEKQGIEPCEALIRVDHKELESMNMKELGDKVKLLKRHGLALRPKFFKYGLKDLREKIALHTEYGISVSDATIECNAEALRDYAINQHVTTMAEEAATDEELDILAKFIGEKIFGLSDAWQEACAKALDAYKRSIEGKGLTLLASPGAKRRAAYAEYKRIRALKTEAELIKRIRNFNKIEDEKKKPEARLKLKGFLERILFGDLAVYFNNLSAEKSQNFNTLSRKMVNGPRAKKRSARFLYEIIRKKAEGESEEELDALLKNKIADLRKEETSNISKMPIEALPEEKRKKVLGVLRQDKIVVMIKEAETGSMKKAEESDLVKITVGELPEEERERILDVLLEDKIAAIIKEDPGTISAMVKAKESDLVKAFIDGLPEEDTRKKVLGLFLEAGASYKEDQKALAEALKLVLSYAKNPSEKKLARLRKTAKTEKDNPFFRKESKMFDCPVPEWYIGRLLLSEETPETFHTKRTGEIPEGAQGYIIRAEAKLGDGEFEDARYLAKRALAAEGSEGKTKERTQKLLVRIRREEEEAVKRYRSAFAALKTLFPEVNPKPRSVVLSTFSYHFRRVLNALERSDIASKLSVRRFFIVAGVFAAFRLLGVDAGADGDASILTLAMMMPVGDTGKSKDKWVEVLEKKFPKGIIDKGKFVEQFFDNLPDRVFKDKAYNEFLLKTMYRLSLEVFKNPGKMNCEFYKVPKFSGDRLIIAFNAAGRGVERFIHETIVGTGVERRREHYFDMNVKHGDSELHVSIKIKDLREGGGALKERTKKKISRDLGKISVPTRAKTVRGEARYYADTRTDIKGKVHEAAISILQAAYPGDDIRTFLKELEDEEKVPAGVRKALPLLNIVQVSNSLLSYTFEITDAYDLFKIHREQGKRGKNKAHFYIYNPRHMGTKGATRIIVAADGRPRLLKQITSIISNVLPTGDIRGYWHTEHNNGQQWLLYFDVVEKTTKIAFTEEFIESIYSKLEEVKTRKKSGIQPVGVKRQDLRTFSEPAMREELGLGTARTKEHLLVSASTPPGPRIAEGFAYVLPTIRPSHLDKYICLPWDSDLLVNLKIQTAVYDLERALDAVMVMSGHEGTGILRAVRELDFKEAVSQLSSYFSGSSDEPGKEAREGLCKVAVGAIDKTLKDGKKATKIRHVLRDLIKQEIERCSAEGQIDTAKEIERLGEELMRIFKKNREDILPEQVAAEQEKARKQLEICRKRLFDALDQEGATEDDKERFALTFEGIGRRTEHLIAKRRKKAAVALHKVLKKSQREAEKNWAKQKQEGEPTPAQEKLHSMMREAITHALRAEGPLGAGHDTVGRYLAKEHLLMEKKFLRGMITELERQMERKRTKSPHSPEFVNVLKEKGLDKIVREGKTTVQVVSELMESIINSGVPVAEKIRIETTVDFIIERHGDIKLLDDTHELVKNEGPLIIVTESLDLYRVLRLFEESPQIVGIITDKDALTSHWAIVGSGRVPVLTSVRAEKGKKRKATALISTGDRVIIEEIEGNAYANPSPSTKEAIDVKKAESGVLQMEAEKCRKNEPVLTRDGASMDFAIDITNPQGFREALSYGFEDVGLLRAEIMYQEGTPSEEELVDMFTRIADATGGKVNIRMFDMQPDKKPKHMKGKNEKGRKGADYLLSEEGMEIAKPLARAIIKAYYRSKNRNVNIFFPMVENGEEARRSREFVLRMNEEVRHELNIPSEEKFDMRIGGMIESKKAVENREEIVEQFDFISVGTNDLISDIRGEAGRKGILTVSSTILPLELIRCAFLLSETTSRQDKDLSFCGEWTGYIKTMLMLLDISKKSESRITLVTKPAFVARLKQIARSADITAVMNELESFILEPSEGMPPKGAVGYDAFKEREKEFNRVLERQARGVERRAIDDAGDKFLALKESPQAQGPAKDKDQQDNGTEGRTTIKRKNPISWSGSLAAGVFFGISAIAIRHFSGPGLAVDSFCFAAMVFLLQGFEITTGISGIMKELFRKIIPSRAGPRLIGPFSGALPAKGENLAYVENGELHVNKEEMARRPAIVQYFYYSHEWLHLKFYEWFRLEGILSEVLVYTIIGLVFVSASAIPVIAAGMLVSVLSGVDIAGMADIDFKGTGGYVMAGVSPFLLAGYSVGQRSVKEGEEQDIFKNVTDPADIEEIILEKIKRDRALFDAYKSTLPEDLRGAEPVTVDFARRCFREMFPDDYKVQHKNKLYEDIFDLWLIYQAAKQAPAKGKKRDLVVINDPSRQNRDGGAHTQIIVAQTGRVRTVLRLGKKLHCKNEYRLLLQDEGMTIVLYQIQKSLRTARALSPYDQTAVLREFRRQESVQDFTGKKRDFAERITALCQKVLEGRQRCGTNGVPGGMWNVYPFIINPAKEEGEFRLDEHLVYEINEGNIAQEKIHLDSVVKPLIYHYEKKNRDRDEKKNRGKDIDRKILKLNDTLLMILTEVPEHIKIEAGNPSVASQAKKNLAPYLSIRMMGEDKGVSIHNLVRHVIRSTNKGYQITDGDIEPEQKKMVICFNRAKSKGKFADENEAKLAHNIMHVVVEQIKINKYSTRFNLWQLLNQRYPVKDGETRSGEGAQFEKAINIISVELDMEERVIEGIDEAMAKARKEGRDVIVVSREVIRDELILRTLAEKYGIKAFVCCHGSTQEHVAILATEQGAQLLVGLPEVVFDELVETWEKSVALYTSETGLEGYFMAGDAARKYTADVIESQIMKDYYIERERGRLKERQVARTIADADEMEVHGNISLPSHLEKGDFNIPDEGALGKVRAVYEHGGNGIALTRTEYMYTRETSPDFEMQRKIYLGIADLANKPITLRTYDKTSDKECVALEDVPDVYSFNYYRTPYGKDALKTQLKAILVAYAQSKYKNLRVMFPQVRTVDDMKFIRNILKEVRDEIKASLEFEGIDKAALDGIPVGIMVENRDAVKGLNKLLDNKFVKVSFMSIGTNDLISDVKGVKREDIEDRHFDKQILGIMEKIVLAAMKRKMSVSICGDVARFDKSLLFSLHLRHKHRKDGATLIPGVLYDLIPKLKTSVEFTDAQKCSEMFRNWREMTDDEINNAVRTKVKTRVMRIKEDPLYIRLYNERIGAAAETSAPAGTKSEAIVTVSNQAGIHMRALAAIMDKIKEFEKFDGKVIIERSADGKRAEIEDVSNLMLLTLKKGSRIKISVEGEGSDEVLKALLEVTEDGEKVFVAEPPAPETQKTFTNQIGDWFRGRDGRVPLWLPLMVVGLTAVVAGLGAVLGGAPTALIALCAAILGVAVTLAVRAKGMNAGIRSSAGSPSGRITEEFKVIAGVPENIYIRIEMLEKELGVRITAVTGSDEETMIRQLEGKIKGEKAIAALLDIDAQTPLDEVKEIIADLKERVTRDIIELTHPEISSLTDENVKRIQNITEMKNVLALLARMLPEGRSYRLSEKSIYDMRINKIYSMHRKDYTGQLEECLKSNLDEEGKRRYMVTAVDTAFDLKLLAESIKERRKVMGVTPDKEDPVEDFVVIRNKDITKDNIGIVLETTGLDLAPDRIIMLGEDEVLTPEEVLEKIGQKTGKRPLINQVAIGQKAGIIDVDPENPGDILRSDSLDSLLLVQLERGLTSQLYSMMLEIMANKDEAPSWSAENVQQVIIKGVRYNLYIYLPKVEAIDLEAEVRNYERYVREVLVKA
ncbi:MAG: putative PEP-binding protein [Candidatus Omnitrophota bacterium]